MVCAQEARDLELHLIVFSLLVEKAPAMGNTQFLLELLSLFYLLEQRQQ
jgi:hypothetical protein